MSNYIHIIILFWVDEMIILCFNLLNAVVPVALQSCVLLDFSSKYLLSRRLVDIVLGLRF